MEDGSHNFLFVCHHWLEVAARTPGVWSFWGNTLADWARWHRHSGTVPLDLVLSFNYSDDEDDPCEVALQDTLQGTLQDRAARDTIRRIHLSSEDRSLLSSIISSLAARCEGVRSNSVESFILLNESCVPLDISDFFAHFRFPKLRRLELNDCKITSWDLLTSRTAVLTTLSLRFYNSSPTPTTSQLLSILTSNPALRKLTLSRYAIPDDGGGGSLLRVPLRHLEDLRLDGGIHPVLGLLHRLDHPGNMDHLRIILSDCAVTDIPQTIGPYLRDHFRRRGRSRNGLGLRVVHFGRHIMLRAGDTCGTGLPDPVICGDWPVTIEVKLNQTPGDLSEKGVLDLIAHTPRDEIVLFESFCGLAAVEDISAHFPNLKALQLESPTVPLSTIFPESGMGGDGGVLPFLQHIGFLSCRDCDDWSPLTAFLARRVSSGYRVGSLMISHSHVCPEVEECIRGIVPVFHYIEPIERCPLGTCSRTILLSR